MKLVARRGRKRQDFLGVSPRVNVDSNGGSYPGREEIEYLSNRFADDRENCQAKEKVWNI